MVQSHTLTLHEQAERQNALRHRDGQTTVHITQYDRLKSVRPQAIDSNQIGMKPGTIILRVKK